MSDSPNTPDDLPRSPRCQMNPLVGELINRERLIAARADLLKQVGTYASIDLTALRESTSSDASQLGRDLREARAGFGVRHGHAWHYPTFQFDARGIPYPEMAEVMAGLGEKARPWDVLSWFTEPNEWLDGRTPLEAWATDRKAIVLCGRARALVRARLSLSSSVSHSP